MTQTIEVPGQGGVDFPSNMSDEDISKAILANFPDMVPERSKEAIAQAEKVLSEPARDNLPSTLVAVDNILDYFGGEGTAKKFSPKISPGVSASVAGFGYGVSDTARGIGQIVGGDNALMGGDDADREGSARAMRKLREDEEVGYSALAGEMVGMMADPVAAAVPIAKGKSIAGMAKVGAASGLLFGGTGYVDEEAGQTRLTNAGLAAVGGMIILPGIGAITNATRKIRGKELIPLRTHGSAESSIESGIIPSPKKEGEVAGLLPEHTKTSLDEAVVKWDDETFLVTPDGKTVSGEELNSLGLTKDILLRHEAPRAGGELPVTKTGAKAETAIEAAAKRKKRDAERESVKSLLKLAKDSQTPAPKTDKQIVLENARKIDTGRTPDLNATGGRGATFYANPLDPTLITKAIDGLKQFYVDTAGISLNAFVNANPGSLATGSVGSVIGYSNFSDEDAPITEKLGNATIGFLLGFGGVKGLNKLPHSERGNVGEMLSGLIKDNHGLPSDFIKLKNSRVTTRNSLLGQTLDLAREATRLSPYERKVLYNIIQGDAPVTADLAGLNVKSRDKITELGQMLVDYGALDAATFNKNKAIYIHRSYLGKSGDAIGWVSRKVRVLGHELQPRGVIKEVSARKLKEWNDLGWETFGKVRNGKVKIRWQLTREQRVAKGEIEDAAYAIAETGRLLSNDIAAFKFYDDIAKNPKFASDVEVDGWSQISTDRIQKTKVNKFGKLAGKWVPEDIYKDLNLMENARAFKNIPIVRAYRKLNSWWKVTKTALNPTVHVNNVMSNIMLYDFADAEYKHLMTAFRELKAVRAQGRDVANAPMLKLAEDMGVFDADFISSELGKLSKQSLDMYKGIEGAENSPFKTALGIAGKTAKLPVTGMLEAYRAEDNFFRLGIFIDRIKKGMAPDVAAADAKRWMIDYNINAPLVNLMRETATPFIAYTYRIVPLLAETATLRPWKFAKWAVAGNIVWSAFENMAGGDTERERKLMPSHQRGNLFGLPFMPEQAMKWPLRIDGISNYLGTTRYIPGGDVLDIEGEEKIIPFLPAPLQPSWGAAGAIAQSFGGYDLFRKKKLEGLGLGDNSDLRIKGEFFLTQMLPNNPLVPGSHSFRKIMDAYRGQATPLGDRLPLWQAFLQTVGVKLRPADLEKMEGRAAWQLKRKVEIIRHSMYMKSTDFDMKRISESQYEEEMGGLVEKVEDLVSLYERRLGISDSDF